MKPTSIRIVIPLVLSLLAAARAQSYGSELNLGVEAYRHSHYDEAIAHFRRATELDPTQNVARMYLATALVSEFIPGVDTKDNITIAEQAEDQYLHVLESDAAHDQKVNAAKGVAYLYLNTKKFDDAKHYYQVASGLDPKDAEPYYSVGVIDWTLCYQPRIEARAQLGMRADDQLNPKVPAQKKVCDELRAKNMPTVEEGIDSLNTALNLRPDYDDAMAYINLLYREKADLECDDPALRAEDLKTVDAWVEKTIATKKIKAAKADPAMQPR